MAPQATDPGPRPGWAEVQDLIAQLCAGRTMFATATSSESSISQYEPGVRLLVEGYRGPRWVAMDDIRACWETFERLGTVDRSDLLEPGRCSAFMFALFAQVDGVVHDALDDSRLALAADGGPRPAAG